jgi:hypothetical protein
MCLNDFIMRLSASYLGCRAAPQRGRKRYAKVKKLLSAPVGGNGGAAELLLPPL